MKSQVAKGQFEKESGGSSAVGSEEDEQTSKQATSATTDTSTLASAWP